jgi:hypothetical protein
MGANLEARGLERTEVIARILAAIPGNGIMAACREGGVSHETWRSWCRADPALEQAAQAALDAGIRDNMDIGHGIGHSLLRQAIDGDRDTRREALDWLSRLILPMAKVRLADYKKEVVHSGSIALEIGPSLAAAIQGPPEVTDPIDEAIDVTPRAESQADAETP